jgi:hypothetical protein
VSIKVNHQKATFADFRNGSSAQAVPPMIKNDAQ